MMLFGNRRQKLQKQKPELQRHPSDGSYSSNATPSKSNHHRRRSSFNGWLSIGAESLDSDVRRKSSTTDPLGVSWSSSYSALAGVDDVDTKDCSLGSSTGISGGADNGGCVLDLIRQLSFSPSRKIKKRTDTAETDVSSSSDNTFDLHHDHDTSHIGLDLDRIEALRRGSPSPLLGLQYLPGDANMYITMSNR
mmetsp:Transcript_20227/g.31587  ORF Transcript_20227/g.31587 Transcript_20227/m.31587 type:complete len:193 (-) Transcript_20227:105-683(-)